jgi:YihY family inner membrane protein
VPETWELTGSDVQETLAGTDTKRLSRDAFQRLRASDGFSHARSMAFATSLIMVQSVIALVGLASAVGEGRLSTALVDMLRDVFPGPAGVVLTDAVQQAHEAGAHNRSLALILGLVGALITGTTLLGQIERAMNRIYGIEQDRTTVKKYGRAFVLTVTAGLLAATAFGVMTLGRAVGRSFGSPLVTDTWSVIRWPLAFGLLLAATAGIYRWSPRRHQPGWSWLAIGAALSVALVTIVTLALNGVFALSSTFGDTYGPLAGFVALLLWALLSSIGLLFGVALSAQLEAVRAGAPQPRRDVAAEVPSLRDVPAPPASVRTTP